MLANIIIRFMPEGLEPDELGRVLDVPILLMIPPMLIMVILHNARILPFLHHTKQYLVDEVRDSIVHMLDRFILEL